MRKPIGTVTLLAGIAMVIAAGVMRMYYSDKQFTASLELNEAQKGVVGAPVKLLSYSTDKSDFRLRYWGALRDQPAELSWDQALKLRQDLASRVNAAGGAGNSASLLRELMPVSILLANAETYSHAATMVRLAFVMLGVAVALIVTSIAMKVRAAVAAKPTLSQTAPGTATAVAPAARDPAP
jgi:hypothetical protein